MMKKPQSRVRRMTKWFRFDRGLPVNCTVDDWLTTEKARLDRFGQWWNRNQAKSPDIFPAQLRKGDWFEEYDYWEENE